MDQEADEMLETAKETKALYEQAMELGGEAGARAEQGLGVLKGIFEQMAEMGQKLQAAPKPLRAQVLAGFKPLLHGSLEVLNTDARILNGIHVKATGEILDSVSTVAAGGTLSPGNLVTWGAVGLGLWSLYRSFSKKK